MARKNGLNMAEIARLKRMREKEIPEVECAKALGVEVALLKKGFSPAMIEKAEKDAKASRMAARAMLNEQMSHPAPPSAPAKEEKAPAKK